MKAGWLALIAVAVAISIVALTTLLGSLTNPAWGPSAGGNGEGGLLEGVSPHRTMPEGAGVRAVGVPASPENAVTEEDLDAWADEEASFWESIAGFSATLQCDVEGLPPGQEVWFVVEAGAEPGGPSAPSQVQSQSGEFITTVNRPSGNGWLHTSGRAPVRVSWSDAESGAIVRCGPVRVEPGGRMVNGVLDCLPRTDRYIHVGGCGDESVVERDRTFQLHAIDETCNLEAWTDLQASNGTSWRVMARSTELPRGQLRVKSCFTVETITNGTVAWTAGDGRLRVAGKDLSASPPCETSDIQCAVNWLATQASSGDGSLE